jgi:hypothetical protein
LEDSDLFPSVGGPKNWHIHFRKYGDGYGVRDFDCRDAARGELSGTFCGKIYEEKVLQTYRENRV